MVIWSQQAVADLRSIHDFIARDSRYYAKKVVHDIRERHCQYLTAYFSENAGIYSALKDVQLFNQVQIKLAVLTWPNGADIDSLWLHEEIVKNETWYVPG